MDEAAHERSRLGAYALGVLDANEARAVDQHVAGCPDCRRDLSELAAMRDMLGEVPPEAFLDGPPEGGDLLLQRTLRRVRQEGSHGGRQRLALAAASVVALAGAALGSGVVIGRQTAPSPLAEQPPTAAASALPGSQSAPPAGTRRLDGTDPATGARLTGTVVPAAGWVRLHVKVDGVPAGAACQLLVVSRTGTRVVAGSWLVSPAGEKAGTELDGAALVPAADVVSVDVVTFQGKKLISVPVA
jgi:hypothetical protein